MTNRALLIASQTAGLRGCHADVDLLAGVLDRWSFQSTVVTDATQEVILAAYRGLIDETTTRDAAVVYYSGHGARIRAHSSANVPTNAYAQFIVPTDFAESTPEVFRGIFAEELRVLQLELSMRTDNVTTILDCCHAALMSRDPALVARFLQRPWAALRAGATARRAQADAELRAALTRPGADHGDAESNQRAVRVVACLPTESAFEMPSDEHGGAVHGLLTAALAGVLGEAADAATRDDLTWDDIAAPLRARVLARAVRQHVVVEGPSRRRIFRPEEAAAERGWPVEVVDGTIHVPGATFVGVGPGDTVTLVPPGRAGAAVRQATVGRIEAGRAILTLDDPAIAGALVPGTVAYPATVSSRRRPVVVAAAPGVDLVDVNRAIVRSSRLVPVLEDTAPLARVVVDDDGMLLVAPDGLAQYAERRPVNPTELDRLVTDLDHLAKVAVLAELVSGTGGEALDVPVALTVHADPHGPALETGVTLPLGAAFVRLHHLGRPTDPPVFVNVVDLGQVGDVTVLSADASPTGIQLSPEQTVQLYGDEGVWLSWPAGLPKDEPRPETFMAVFSDRELDIRAVATGGISVRAAPDPSGVGTLRAHIDLASSGTTRAIGNRPTPGQSPLRYRVERFEFLLDPPCS